MFSGYDGPDPVTMRALSFAAALGPARRPVTQGDEVIDLAGEEALLAYLARLRPTVPADGA